MTRAESKKIADLERANVGLAKESIKLRIALSELVEAVDGMDDLDEMDGDEFQVASKRLEAAMAAARPMTEAELIARAEKAGKRK